MDIHPTRKPLPRAYVFIFIEGLQKVHFYEEVEKFIFISWLFRDRTHLNLFDEVKRAEIECH
ncbi:MAG: hypothetical protein QNJ54_34955 [Prochloraceae cyanobacterium]|nr:hypothetical protein [Prochloraceae cyanobacterium]